MTEINYTTIGAVLMAVILTASGTIYLTKTGQDSACKAGWQLVTEGEREGQYVCTSSTPDRYQWCYAIRNSSNTLNYWCEIGIVDHTDPEDMNVSQPVDDGGSFEEKYAIQLSRLESLDKENIDGNDFITYNVVYSGFNISYSLGKYEVDSMTEEEVLTRLLNYFESVLQYNTKEPLITVLNDTKAEAPIIKSVTSKEEAIKIINTKQ